MSNGGERGTAEGTCLITTIREPRRKARRLVRRLPLVLVAIVLALICAQSTTAATRTWTGLGATNNWNDVGNWSGGVVPGAADVATFDATSSKNAVMNVAVNVGGVSIAAAYGGTISQAAGIAATVGATGWTQAGGTFTGGTAAFTVNGPFAISGGTYAATTATLSVSGAFTDTGGAFNAGTGTVSFGGGAATLSVSTADTFNNLTLAAGTKTVAAGTTLTVNGTTTLTAGAINGPGALVAKGNISQAVGYAGGTATVTIGGAGAQTFTGASTTAAGALPLIAINKPSGTLTIAGTLRTANNWTYTAGTVDSGASTLVFVGGTVTGNQTLAAVDVRGTTTIAAGTTLTVSGSLSLTGGTFNTGTVAAFGNISQTSAFANGTATLTIAGAGAQTFTGAATTAAGDLPAIVINKATGKLTLAGTIRTTHNWTYTAGTVDPATSTVVFAGTQTIAGSQTLTDVVFNNTTVHTIPAPDTLTVTGALTLADGSIGTGTLAATGSIDQAAAFDGGTGTLLINGGGAQTFTGASTTAAGLLPLVVINKPSATLTLAGTIRTASNWTYTAGTLDPGTSTLVFAGGTITGSHTLNAVDLRATTSIAAGTTLTVSGSTTLTTGALNGTGTLAAQGAISQASTATVGTATLLINGAGAQTLTGAATTAAGALPLIVINKPSGTLTLAGTIRTSTNWTYTAGTLDPGASTLVFAGGTVTGSHTLNILDFRATSSIAAGTTLTAAGGVTLTAGSLNGTGTLAAQADVSQVLAYPGGTATLAMTGAGAQTLTGASTTVSGDLPLFVINKPSGTLTLAGTIRTSRNWTYTAGTVDPGTSMLVFAGGTISGSHTLNAVDFRTTTSIAAGTTLTVAGSTTLTSGSLNGTGTLAAQGSLSQTFNSTGGTASLLINGAAGQTFTGAATTAGGDLPVLVINKASGTLVLAGTIRTTHNWTYAAGTVDAGTSTVLFSGGTITGSHTLNIVDFRTTTSIAAGTTLTATGSVSLTAGAINGTGTLAARGAIGQASTTTGGTATLLVNGSGAQTFTGAATTVAGALPLVVINKPGGTLSLAGTIRTATNWTYIAGTVDAGTSMVVLAGGTVSSAGMSFYDVTTNGGTTTLGNAMTIGRNLTIVGGTLTTSASSQSLTIGGDVTVGSTFRWNGSAVAIAGNLANNGTIVPGTSTLTLNGSAGQSIGGTTATPAFNVVVNDPLGVTLNANLTVSGTVTLTSGPLAVGPRLLTISNAIAGTPTNLVTTGSSSLTVTGAGAGIAVPTSVMLLGTLTLNNANGLSALADVTINGALTLTTGRLDAGVSTIVIGPAGTVVRTGGWVVGRLEKYAAAGAAVGLTFEIGDAARYTPVTVAFGTITTPGDLTASTTTGDHPNVASSGVAGSRSVNRYWTVTNTGIVFDTYDATYTFAAADVDSGANPTAFIVAKRDGAIWTRPTVGARTATTTKATGMTAFSEFAIGEPSADLGVTIDDGLASVIAGDGLTHAYLISVTNGGPSDAGPVSLDLAWPTGFSQGLVSPSQGSCAPVAGPDLACALGSIVAGGSATVSVAYTVPASTDGGPESATATVSSPAVDPVAADNSAADATTVVETATLVVATTDGQTSVPAGTTGWAYTISVTNQGPSDADTVRVDDAVPAAVTAGGPSADLGGDCTASAGNTIACSLPASLTPGATWTITVPYAVPAATAAQTVTNTALATSAENPAGVTAADPTDVTVTPSPTPTSTPGPTPTPTSRPTPTPASRPTPTPGPTASPAASAGSTASASPPVDPAASATPGESAAAVVPTTGISSPSDLPGRSRNTGAGSSSSVSGSGDQWLPLELAVGGSMVAAIVVLLVGIARRRRERRLDPATSDV